MAVVLDDLPPLMWHAELGRGLPDVWTGDHHRGAQLHDLMAAVQQRSNRLTARRGPADELRRPRQVLVRRRPEAGRRGPAGAEIRVDVPAPVQGKS
jgi:hypothetical protein